MLKKDILDLIESFEIETFKYNDNENLDNDMQYIYSIEKEVKNANDSELQLIYKKIISTIGIIRFKYGFESEIIKINPNFKDGWIDLARLEINKDSYDKAKYYLNISKYIDDNDCRYYYYLGLVLKNKGLTAEANKNFEKSLNLNPNYQPVKEELQI